MGLGPVRLVRWLELRFGRMIVDLQRMREHPTV